MITSLAALLALLFAPAIPGAVTGDIRGTVFTVDSDGEKSFLVNAQVRLDGPSLSLETVTDGQGIFRFTDVAAANYRIQVKAKGFVGSQQVTVAPGGTVDTPIEVKVEAAKESVTVEATDEPMISKESSSAATINRATVVNAPNRYDRFESVLPLVPGVVRGPDGLINMKGARSSQSGALLNSANVTDPATGTAAINLPIDVVQSVKVIPNPYDPEYGRLAGAVSNVETTTSNFDAFHFSIQNVLVRPRKRSGDFVGIESATPRLTLTGPIVKHKIAFTESFEYRFIRIPVSSLPQLQRDMKLEGFNSYSQADIYLTQKQSMTASFALYPQEFNYLGLNTFTPQEATPDLHQRGYMGSIQHRYVTGPDSMLVSQFSYKRFDADVTSNGSDPYLLLIETTEGGYFNRQFRNTYRTEWQETYQFVVREFLGSHQFKVGTDFAHSDYEGRITLLPVMLIGVANVPIESITFGSASRFDLDQNEIAWFVADKWQPLKRLTFDLGVRFDRDSVTDSIHTAPRAGFAVMLTNDAKTLLKGGAGVFYDRVPLNVASFPLLPGRTVATYDPSGEIVDQATYVNTVTEGRLRNARSVNWNVELDRQVTKDLVVRAGFQQRDTTRDFLLTPRATAGVLSLSNGGSSFYREFQLSSVYKMRRATLNASYLRSKAYGDLNDFNQFLGNNAAAVIQPNGRGRLPFDAPNRVLLFGQWDAPWKLTVLPVFDVHTGFPYSIVDEYRDFIGPRDSQRLRRFNSFDMQVTRPIRVPFFRKEKLKARIGFSVFNLFNHFNPRDVQNDVDSDRFDSLFNGVGRTFRGKFVLEF